MHEFERRVWRLIVLIAFLTLLCVACVAIAPELFPDWMRLE